MNTRNLTPAREDLLAVAAYSAVFEEPDFIAGEWVKPEPLESGVFAVGWWNGAAAVDDWNRDLYEHNIVDPDSDYLSEETVDLVRRLIQSPAVVHDLDLSTLRRALTFLVRAERHSGGGWFEDAFATGFAQASTRRLGELAAEM